jgi:hypothetical protein
VDKGIREASACSTSRHTALSKYPTENRSPHNRCTKIFLSWHRNRIRSFLCSTIKRPASPYHPSVRFSQDEYEELAACALTGAHAARRFELIAEAARRAGPLVVTNDR